MIVKVWDKKEPINGKSAEYVLSYRDDLKNEKDVILICDDYGNAQQTLLASMLRGMLGLDNSLSALEVGEKYIENLKEQKEQIQPDTQNTNNLVKELANTKLENIQLKNISEQTIKELSETKLKMMELENKINTLGGTK